VDKKDPDLIVILNINMYDRMGISEIRLVRVCRFRLSGVKVALKTRWTASGGRSGADDDCQAATTRPTATCETVSRSTLWRARGIDPPIDASER
jgi:hypothetical protein